MNALHYSVAALALAIGIAAAPADAAISYDVEPGQNPSVTLMRDQELYLHIPKQSYETYQISFQGDGVNFTAPIHTQDTYYFDAKQYPSRRVTYTVKTMDNQTISSGDIINQYVHSYQTSIESVLNLRTNYDYSAYQKSEPRYYSRSNVRGYW